MMKPTLQFFAKLIRGPGAGALGVVQSGGFNGSGADTSSAKGLYGQWEPKPTVNHLINI